MGTNYYQIIDCCEKCGRGSEEVHIGKSSMGWPFSVHILPEEGINNWGDWYTRLSKGGVIKDEYGGIVALEELNALVISKREYKDKPHVLKCYQDYPRFNTPDPETGDKLCRGEYS